MINWQFFLVFFVSFLAGMFSMAILVANRLDELNQRRRRPPQGPLPTNPPPGRAAASPRYPSNVNKYPPHTWEG